MRDISVSILNASNRLDSVKKLNTTDCKYIHVDVMDGKFVPNKQFSSTEIKKIGALSLKELDIHLMVENPIHYLKYFGLLNISYITFHIEIKKDIHNIINEIKKYGFKVGIAINPTTDIEEIYPYLKNIDLVLIMSVPAGYGGQPFDINTVERIKIVSTEIKTRQSQAVIEVDGGINNTNVNLLTGVDIVVAGSYIINSNNYQGQIDNIKGV